ncbi:hypothetical protein Acr_00g0064180 [Actinidia rufa]|uniref:Uncharacterized protein n=1 Tax=Actinidia rufa TaxID=165716 RepID=A0A7J0DPZ4_9ERIC|nr:hypothetical protein Acr_00g0064180 [Actinidia rufa]
MSSNGGNNAEGKLVDDVAASGDEGSSNSSSSLSLEAMSESWLLSELRSDGMSKRISLKKLAQKVDESKIVRSSTMSTLSTKGVVIQEKRPSPKRQSQKGRRPCLLLGAKKAKSSATLSAPATKGTKPAVGPREGTSANPPC